MCKLSILATVVYLSVPSTASQALQILIPQLCDMRTDLDPTQEHTTVPSLCLVRWNPGSKIDSEPWSQKLEDIYIKKKVGRRACSSPYLPGLRWNINIKHTSHSSIMIVQYMAMERQFCGLRTEFVDQKKSCQTQIGHKLLQTMQQGWKLYQNACWALWQSQKIWVIFSG